MSDLAKAIAKAIEVRAQLDLPPSTTLVRLFHDAADGIPGLVIDRYGAVARIDVRESSLAADADIMAKTVLNLLPKLQGVALIERPKGGGLKAKVRLVRGEVAEGVLVTERGMTFLVRLLKAHAPLAGAFVDLREGRAAARAAAKGRPALNLFGHAGAFGVAMATGGASRVDHVDAARSCAPWAALNLALNGFDPRQHRYIVDDAFKVLRRAAKRGPTYGVIAADPPTTAVKPTGGRFVAGDELASMAKDAATALAPGGMLILTTNDRRITSNDVTAAARAGARQANREVETLVPLQLPPDLMPTGRQVGDIPVRGVCMTVR